jgi:hypothetical protein
MKSASRKRDRIKDARVYLDWILLVLILFLTFVAIILVPALLTVDKLVSVPYALHSILNADYGVDDLALSYAQVKSDIIAEVIRDQNVSMLGDITEKPALNPPIAFATPNTGLTATSTTNPGQPTSTPAPTDGAFSPTATNIYPSPTSGGYPTATQPSVTDNPPNSTAIATTASPTQAATTHPSDSTSRPPTRTSAPTTQAPDPTSRPPTQTSAPTSPPPTPTPVPPTRTPAPTSPPPTNTPRPPDPTDPPDPYPPPPPPGNTPYP